MMTLDEIPVGVWQRLRPKFDKIYDMWPVSERPAVLDEMMPDINRLIHSVATRFSDQTCAHLHVDEMMGECRLKLAEVIDRGELERQPTRGNFFKFFKTALQNQARSRVQKYRFTEKRTGIKPPPREQRVYTVDHEDDEVHHDTVALTPEHHKNVELSLDDEETNLQVSTAQGLSGGDDTEYQETMQEYKSLLTPQESLIFQQMASPNEQAYWHAFEDGCYLKSWDKVQVKIKNIHLALGLGIKPEHFEEYVLTIRQKILAYRTMTDAERLQETRRNAALAQLKQVFGLQIPPGTDDMLVRRLLTIAARDQFSKLKENTQLQEMLELVGAKVPRMQADGNLSCYGVLYQKNHRHCNHCGLRESCAVEAANVGLGKIALSPRLLGARQTRVPVVLPVESDEPLPDLGSPDSAELISYLDETFVRTSRRNESYFSLRGEDTEKRTFLFCIEDGGTEFRLRFCNPSKNLRARLEVNGRSWYTPATASVADVISLIDQHAKESMEGVNG